MKKFKCLKCGGNSYSSADLQYQTNPGCPYCASNKVVKDTGAPFQLEFNGRIYDIVEETDTHFVAAPQYRDEGYGFISTEAVRNGV